MKHTLSLLLIILCASACHKKNNATPAPRIPASFTGTKIWRSATNPTSPRRDTFNVTTQGRDDITIEGTGLSYTSTDSSKDGYKIKYDGGPFGASEGHTSATFIHTTTGDTIYYSWESEGFGRPPVTASFVTP